MSTQAAPQGLQVAYHPSGEVRLNNIVDGILSGYNTNLFKGSPVQMGTDGTIKAVTAANDPIYGVFAGCEYTLTDGTRKTGNIWPANTTYVAGSMIAKVCPLDGSEHMIAQTAATVAATARGEGINMTGAPSGSTYTGLSSQALAAPTGATAASFTIHDVVKQPDNDWGDPFVWLIVKVQNRQGPVA